jgi:hypothetical protein
VTRGPIGAMNSDQISRRLDVIEGLLRGRHFDLALALAVALDEGMATAPPSIGPVRVPTHLRRRARAVRWAGEVGLRLNHLIDSAEGRRHRVPWRWRSSGRPRRRARGLLGAVLGRAFRGETAVCAVRAEERVEPWLN